MKHYLMPFLFVLVGILTLEACSKKESLKHTNSMGGIYTQSDSVYKKQSQEDSLRFLTDWENMTSYHIYHELQGDQQVDLPWVRGASVDMPDEIRFDVKSEDGWEMAFNYLSKRGLNSGNFFGLYNKYLGIFRIFYYLNPPPQSSELSFCVNLGSSGASTVSQRGSMYGALEYMIPCSHKSIKRESGSADFTPYFSTYRQVNKYKTSLQIAWYAFDIDMSAYCEYGLPQNESIGIHGNATTVTDITLSGSLAANITGTYTNVSGQAASSKGGVSSTFATIKDFYSNTDFSDVFNYTDPISMVKCWAGAITNLASYLDGDDEQSEDPMPGTISQTLTGTFDITGYSSTLTSVDMAIIEIARELVNEKCHLGYGVWNLAEDPVVYVLDNHIVGDAEKESIVQVNDDGTCTVIGTAEDYGLRYVTFFDPTSISLNLNTDVFTDVTDVNVDAYCGVYPGKDVGYTDDFRGLLDLSTRNSININLTNNTSTGMKELSDCMTYTKMYPEDYNNQYLEVADSCKIHKQTGDYGNKYWVDLYGHYNVAEGFMVDPQVYFPVSEKLIFGSDIPDMVVCVWLSFKSGGKTYTFTKRFIPEIKTISSTELTTKISEIQAFANKSQNKETVGNLNNDSSVSVYSYSGYVTTSKSLNILNNL